MEILISKKRHASPLEIKITFVIFQKVDSRPWKKANRKNLNDCALVLVPSVTIKSLVSFRWQMNSVPERAIVSVSLYTKSQSVTEHFFELFLWCINRFVNEILETRIVTCTIECILTFQSETSRNPESYCPAGLSFMSQVETRKRHSLNKGYAEASLMEGGVRVCGIAVLGYFWCRVAVIFISKYGILGFQSTSGVR